MEPPTLSTGSHSVASPSVLSKYQERAVLGVVYNPFLDYLVRGFVVPSNPR